MYSMGFPDGSVVKNLPANAGDSVQSLDQEDPLEKEMATHSCILAWRIPWTEEPCEIQSMGSQEMRYDLVTKHFYFHNTRLKKCPKCKDRRQKEEKDVRKDKKIQKPAQDSWETEGKKSINY